MTETTTKQTVTFISLLEKYNGDIIKAKKSELRQVKESGLKNLFGAYREFDYLEKHKQKCPFIRRALSGDQKLTN